MASSSRHYCTVCRTWYRSWSLHASSKLHMSNLRKRANPSSSRKGIRGGLGPKAARRRAGEGHGADMVDVDAYKRNPPTPPWPAWLTERLVRVRHHFRRLPYVPSRAARPAQLRSKRDRDFVARARAIARARGWV